MILQTLQDLNDANLVKRYTELIASLGQEGDIFDYEVKVKDARLITIFHLALEMASRFAEIYSTNNRSSNA